MRILVTGHRGFIGSNLVKNLQEFYSHEVFTYHWGDTWPTWDLDWVIHLGAISSTTEGNVEKILTQNYEFTMELLHRCEENDVNIQYASSGSVYGLGRDFRETAPPDPRTPYAWTKYLVDRYVLSRDWPIRVQGFRYFNVYGPGEDHKPQPSPFTIFRKQAKETGVIKVFEGSENVLRDFVPVETVIDIQKKFFDVEESGIWNIGTDTTRSFQSIAEEVAAETGATIETVPMPEKLKGSYQYFTQADLTKLKKTLSGIWP